MILMCFYFLVDYVDPVEKAPFDIDNEHIKVMSNEERIKVGGILCILVLGTMSGTSYCRLPSAIGRKKNCIVDMTTNVTYKTFN